MAKRKRKETAEVVNGASTQTKFTSRLFDDKRKLREIAVACGHLKRVAEPGPTHVAKFIDRVFALAGIEPEAQHASQSEAGS
jgi:hypothetical protein